MPKDNAIEIQATAEFRQPVANQENSTQLSKLVISGDEFLEQRKFLTTTSSFYSQQVDKINPELFSFLNQAQRRGLEETLLSTFCILTAQYQLISNFQMEAEDSTRDSLRKLTAQIKKCAHLIQTLRNKNPLPQEYHALVIDNSEKYLKYLGFNIAKEVVQGIDDMITRHVLPFEAPKGEANTVIIKGGINDISTGRSNWGLNSNLVLAVIGALPEHFFNVDRAQQEIKEPSEVMGYLGWTISYAVLGIDLFLVAKHTIRGPWMKEAEKNLSLGVWDRFTTQFDQRKFSILDRFMAGTTGMVCFFWLALTDASQFLVLGVLIADIFLTTWRWIEEDTNQKKEIARYQSAIDAIDEEINKLVDYSEEKERLIGHKNKLIEAQAQAKVDSKYKTYHTIGNICYKLSIVVAVSVMYYFLFPAFAITNTAKVIMSVVGAGAYFIFSIINKSYSGGVDIHKSKSSQQLTTIECEKMLAQFEKLNQIAEPSEQIIFEKKQLYLEMKRLIGDSEYQDHKIKHQKLKLVHGLVVALLMPTLLFVSLTFMPMGVGFAVLAIAVLVAGLSAKLLKEPTVEPLPEFNEEAFNKFAKTPSLAKLKDEVEHSKMTKAHYSEQKNEVLNIEDDYLSGVKENIPKGA